MERLLKIFVVFGFLLLLTWLLDCASYCTLQDNLFLKSECTYTLPSNMWIETDGKKYIVGIHTYTEEYLCDTGLAPRRIRTWSLEISKPTVLYSECKARALAKKYIEQENRVNLKFDHTNFVLVND